MYGACGGGLIYEEPRSNPTHAGAGQAAQGASMSAVVLPFRRKPKSPPPANHARVYILWSGAGGEIHALDEQGAASMLGLSLDEFRKQAPVPPVDGIEVLFYAEADVIAEMRKRGIAIECGPGAP